MKRVTTVIVNYKLKYFLEQTLLSVEEAYTEVDGHTIVIDNNSGDDSIDFLEERFPSVTFILNKENVGFARANNQGFALADTDFILVLNPDTIIGSDTLKDTVKWMDEHPECGAIGVKMVDGNGHFLPESKRSFPSTWNSFCKLFGLSTLFPKSRLFARYHLRYLNENEPHQVPVLAGAFMLLRTDLTKKIGGFDEDFFMYGEDMDLSFRMITDNMVNYYLPTPIIHYKGECTKTESLNYVKIFYEAMHIFYRKHYPRSSWFNKIVVKAAIVFRMVISAITTTLIKPITQLFKRKVKACDTYIVSRQPNNIMNIIENEGFSSNNIFFKTSVEEIPTTTKGINIIIDDRDMNYQSIINNIITHRDSRRFYHIYSSRNNLIISPKRQR